MFKLASDWIVRKLQKYLPEQEHMHSALSYGVDMALYTVVSTMGLLLIALALGALVPGTIMIATCYLNQTIGGGYHASSHMKCFCSMTILLLLGIALARLPIPLLVMCAVSVVSLIVLLLIPVILHPNRAFLKERLPHFIRRSRYTSIAELILAILLAMLQASAFNAYGIGLALSAISRIAAKHGRRDRDGA